MKAYSENRLEVLESEAKIRSNILNSDPADEDQYEELNKYLNDTNEFVAVKNAELAKIGDIIEIIENNFNNCDYLFAELRKSWKIPFNIIDYYRKGNDNLEMKKIEFSANLELKKKELVVLVNELEDR